MVVGVATTAATCLTNTNWIWASINTGLLHEFTRSTIVTDAAELWKNGGRIVNDAAAPAGLDPVHIAVGGVNSRESYGMGIWNLMLWAADKDGKAETTALYGATFTELDLKGSGSLEISMLN